MTPNGDCCHGTLPIYQYPYFAIPATPAAGVATGSQNSAGSMNAGAAPSPHLLIGAQVPPLNVNQLEKQQQQQQQQQMLDDELKHLRQRLKAIESDNLRMSSLLKEQQNNVNLRLDDLEHHVTSSHLEDSDDDDTGDIPSNCHIDLSNFSGPCNLESII